MKPSIQYSLAALTLSLILFTPLNAIADTAFLQNNTPILKTKLDHLLSLSCDTAGYSCIAVGYGEASHPSDRTIYITSDGGETWSKPIVLPGVKDEISQGVLANINPTTISCDASAQRCVIASAALINHIPTPIVYNTLDNGLTWSEPTILPLPKTVDKKQKFDYPSAISTHVSCGSSGLNCLMAVGIIGERKMTPFMFNTKNGGETWIPVKDFKEKSNAPKAILHGTFLTDVKCDKSGLSCLVTGVVMTKNSSKSNYYSTKPILYSTLDGGTHWKNPTILPTEISNQTGSALISVACDDSNIHCTTIGHTKNFDTNLYQHFSFTTKNGGLTWGSQQNIQLSYSNSSLEALSCDTTGANCIAVGGHQTTSTHFKPWIFQTADNGKSWFENAQIRFPDFSYLRDIYCSNDIGHCLAVGTSVNSNYNHQPIAKFSYIASKKIS